MPTTTAAASATPTLPPGRHVMLPGRGRTWVRELPGPAGAPTLVLLHGWTATADLNWFRCYGALGREFRVVALDHRGHGRGIRSRRTFRLADAADDVAALVRELRLGPVIPVGYSMGGAVAQLVWHRHRDLVRGLVLSATSYRFGSESGRMRAFGAGMLGLSAVAKVTPGVVRREVAQRVLTGRVEGPFGEWVASELRRNDPSAVLAAGSALMRYDSSPWLPLVDVPTAVVMTTHDSLVPPLRQARLAALIPGAEVEPVAGDHGACVLEADRYVPALVRACRSVALRSA